MATYVSITIRNLSMALECGQVIALRRNAIGIVLTVDPMHVIVVPIGGYNGPPPHRAEVRFDEPNEIFSCGVSYRYPVARCHMAFQVTAVEASAATLLGKAPTSLMIRVTRAIRREIENRGLEARLHFSDRGQGFSPAAA